MAGYIKLWRGSRDTDGLAKSDHFSDWEAWTWLLENAAWKDLSRWNAKGQEVRLSPGQIHVSLRSLATSFGWSKSKVERFLSRLQRVKKAGLLKGQSGIVLTIENWEKYQGDGTATETATIPVVGQSRDTQEEGKEGKEEKNSSSYPFFGRTIRLNENDLSRWRQRYHSLADIEAELGSLDDWLQGEMQAKARENWFHVVSGALNKKHQAAISQSSDDGKLEMPIC